MKKLLVLMLLPLFVITLFAQDPPDPCEDCPASQNEWVNQTPLQVTYPPELTAAGYSSPAGCNIWVFLQSRYNSCTGKCEIKITEVLFSDDPNSLTNTTCADAFKAAMAGMSPAYNWGDFFTYISNLVASNALSLVLLLNPDCLPAEPGTYPDHLVLAKTPCWSWGGSLGTSGDPALLPCEGNACCRTHYSVVYTQNPDTYQISEIWTDIQATSCTNPECFFVCD